MIPFKEPCECPAQVFTESSGTLCLSRSLFLSLFLSLAFLLSAQRGKSSGSLLSIPQQHQEKSAFIQSLLLLLSLSL